jgi:predicted ester cyclase
MGIGATGKEVTFSGIIFIRLASGKIVEWWGHWDALGLMNQLGATTVPDDATR